MREKVAVLGGGSWGTTLAHLLAENGHETLLWLRREELIKSINEDHENTRHLKGLKLSGNLRATSDLEEAVTDTPTLVFAIPSKAFRGVVGQASPFMQGDQVVLSATKGFEKVSGMRMTEVLRDESCCRKVGAISGPNLAKEIVAGQPAATVIASRYDEVIERGASLFHSKLFRIYGNRDVIGVEIGGALKNIIAIAAGVCNGLGYGDNTKSLLITRGLAEISRFGCMLGADPVTFSGLAGVGDLMVTCASKLSRNFRVGFRLGQGETLEEILGSMVEVAEGVRTTAIALEIAKKIGATLPIAEGMNRLLNEGASTKDVVQLLMTRRAKYELPGAPNYADSEIPSTSKN
jgi:glycerol-3-phosphate dehydrogenase (NAD(P)+)